MDTGVLKKRLNTYKSGNGRLNQVDEEVVMEVLRAWEQWQGRAVELYRGLGLSKMQLVTMIQKAKRLVKNGAGTSGEFKEVKVVGATSEPGDKVELIWDNGRTIRFSGVGQLLEFLNRVGKSDNI